MRPLLEGDIVYFWSFGRVRSGRISRLTARHAWVIWRAPTGCGRWRRPRILRTLIYPTLEAAVALDVSRES